MEAWFQWKGEVSTARGLRVLQAPPVIRATPLRQRVVVPGRSGWLTLSGPPVYAPVEVEIRFLLPPRVGTEGILPWLSGRGELVLSGEPDRLLRAEAVETLPLRRLPDGAWEGSVAFFVQPLKAEYPPQPAITVAGSGDGSTAIKARGDVAARPVYRVEGTGTVVLTVGEGSETGTGSVLSVALEEGMDGFVVDTDAAMVTSLDGTENLSHLCELFYNGFRGLWLPSGDTTTVSWTGSVTSVSIDPRWRWL
ncbi:MAG: hypothetical protein IKH77_06230 [Clostridia bacterium]|nr:hypothetical protein [Clostridia bacterium]